MSEAAALREGAANLSSRSISRASVVRRVHHELPGAKGRPAGRALELCHKS